MIPDANKKSTTSLYVHAPAVKKSLCNSTKALFLCLHLPQNVQRRPERRRNSLCACRESKHTLRRLENHDRLPQVSPSMFPPSIVFILAVASDGFIAAKARSSKLSTGQHAGASWKNVFHKLPLQNLTTRPLYASILLGLACRLHHVFGQSPRQFKLVF